MIPLHLTILTLISQRPCEQIPVRKFWEISFKFKSSFCKKNTSIAKRPINRHVAAGLLSQAFTLYSMAWASHSSGSKTLRFFVIEVMKSSTFLRPSFISLDCLVGILPVRSFVRQKSSSICCSFTEPAMSILLATTAIGIFLTCWSCRIFWNWVTESLVGVMKMKI